MMRKYSWLSGFANGLSVGALTAGMTTGSLIWLGAGITLFFVSYWIPSDPMLPRSP